MVEQLSTLLGIAVPMQFEPVITLIASMFLVLLVAFFAEILKLIIVRS